MIKESSVFLKHILNAIIDVEESTKNLCKKEFEENKDVKDATVRRIEIIGEATKNLTSEFRKKYPNIEWRDIAGTRDKMIHHYFGVDLDIVWDIVKKDLPKLKENIKEILEKEK